MTASSPLRGGRYEIVVAASADGDWTTWFDDFELATEGETCRLTGSVVDQAALHGALARLRDLGIPIVEVHQLSREGEIPDR